VLGPALALALAAAPVSEACEDDADRLSEAAAAIVAASPRDAESVARARDLVRRARLSTLWPPLLLTLRAADLAAAAGDVDDEARLLQAAARDAPELLSAPDRLVLARQAEARGDRRDAMLQYGHVLAAQERRGLPAGAWIGERIRRLDAEEEAKSVPVRPGFAPPSAEARAAFAEGKTFLARGASAGARGAFRRALGISPGYVEAALALGTLEEREGRDVEAAAAFRTALAADPDRFDAVLALANLLWNEPDRPAKEESLALLDRAIALKPGMPRLLREAADRWAAWGDPARALERLDAWRATATPAGRQATDPLREKLVASLTRPVGSATGAAGALAEASPAAPSFRLAQVYLRRGDASGTEHAIRELEEAVRLDSAFVPAWELLATVRSQAGDAPGAEEALRKALDVDPSRASSWERLAEILERQPGRAADAKIAWQKAEHAGSFEAFWALGRLASADGRELEAIRWWRRYVEEAPDGLHVDEARAAVDRMDRRFQTLRGAGIGLAAFAVLLGAGLILRGRRGLTLAEWLRRDPGATREVRPVLGRLSHEVFKHGGLLLGDAEERLASGEDFRPSAEILASRLYGSGAGPGLVAEGRAGLEDLAAVARRRGAALNLRHKDPLFSPVAAGLDALDAAHDDLASLAAGRALPQRRRAALAARLGRAAAALNPRAAQQLARLVDAAGSTEASWAALVGLLASVAGEMKAAPPEIEPLGLFAAGVAPLRVKLPAAEWETIFRNLFANALGSPRLGLLAEERRDPVTGQAQGRFILYDADPRPLTAEMIRGRGAERGLGVVADVVRRWDGAVDVVPGAPGFTKGVSVEFAVVEGAP
jgi:tetratricopeptide (TPR) repeat protein